MQKFSEFITQADAYAQFRPSYPDTLFSALAEQCVAHQQVWDVGTGNGQAAVSLASYFQQVLASDVNAAQLQQAMIHPHVQYLRCTAEQAPLADGSMDLITVAQALHWFSFEHFFAEVKRILKPNGVFAAWTYARCQLATPSLDAYLDSFYRQVIGPYWPPQRRWVDQAYEGIHFPFTPLSMVMQPLQQQWTLAHFMGYLSSWSAVTHYQKQVGENPLIVLEQQLKPLWGHDTEQTQPVRWTLTIKAGRK